MNNKALRLRPAEPSLIGAVFLCVITLAGLAWTLTAFSFQIAPPWQWISSLATILLAVAIVGTGIAHRGRAWLMLAVAALAVAVWWASILPSNDRDWAADVAHGVTAQISGDTVTLTNVRNFDWRSESDFTPRWETRRYGLDDIKSVDLVSSVWDNPAIAHTLISFGFSDGGHLVFSAEIRRQRREVFSAIGGFFKEFELVLIAAEESDILRLRTNIRREDVSLFPLRLTDLQARALFLSYLEKANALAARPQFYQTITANCTTVIFQLARIVEPKIPTDWRILLSGYLPDYLYANGIVATDLPLDEVKRRAAISRRALEADPALAYSTAIRAGL